MSLGLSDHKNCMWQPAGNCQLLWEAFTRPSSGWVLVPDWRKQGSWSSFVLFCSCKYLLLTLAKVYLQKLVQLQRGTTKQCLCQIHFFIKCVTSHQSFGLYLWLEMPESLCWQKKPTLKDHPLGCINSVLIPLLKWVQRRPRSWSEDWSASCKKTSWENWGCSAWKGEGCVETHSNFQCLEGLQGNWRGTVHQDL